MNVPWTLMDTDGSSGAALASRKRCAARLEASCPWIVHVSSMFRPWFILAHQHDSQSLNREQCECQ